MKNWKKESALAVVASGMFGGTAAVAQPVNTNLVLNPSFEMPGSGNVSNWTGSALSTYQYSQGYTSINVPPSPGLQFLRGGMAASGNTTQTINLVAAGFTPAFIDAGPSYSLSGYFSSYFKTDFAAISVRFLNAASAQIGASSSIGGQAFIANLGTGNNLSGVPGFTNWGQDATGGVIPVGTRFVSVDILHTRVSGSASDSYVDLVKFQITPPPCLADVNASGAVSIDDLLAVINGWGRCLDPGNCPADIAPAGGDDTVNVDDLLAVINNWGPCP